MTTARTVVVFTGKKGPKGDTGGVTSVNGKTGVVILDYLDVGADPAGTATTAVAVHTARSTGIHGIADTNLLLTTSTKLDQLAAPTDVTTLNATTLTHGLAAKLSGSSLEFWNGVGGWAVPPGGGGGSGGTIDGGAPDSVYGGTDPIDGGTP